MVRRWTPSLFESRSDYFLEKKDLHSQDPGSGAGIALLKFIGTLSGPTTSPQMIIQRNCSELNNDIDGRQ